jgi:hypothetical protein
MAEDTASISIFTETAQDISIFTEMAREETKHTDARMAEVTASISIFPRPKAPENDTNYAVRGRAPLKMSLQLLKSKFELSLKDAAIYFGISRTALKQACRRLGVHCWPYKRKSFASNPPAPAAQASGRTSSASTVEGPLAMLNLLEEATAREQKSQNSSMGTFDMRVNKDASEEEAPLAGLKQFCGLHGYEDDLAWLVQMDPSSLAKKDKRSTSFAGEQGIHCFGNSEKTNSMYHISNSTYHKSWVRSYIEAAEELDLIMSTRQGQAVRAREILEY